MGPATAGAEEGRPPTRDECFLAAAAAGVGPFVAHARTAWVPPPEPTCSGSSHPAVGQRLGCSGHWRAAWVQPPAPARSAGSSHSAVGEPGCSLPSRRALGAATRQLMGDTVDSRVAHLGYGADAWKKLERSGRKQIGCAKFVVRRWFRTCGRAEGGRRNNL